MCVVLILFSNQAPPSLSLSLSLSFSLGLLTFKQGAKALLLGHETSEREREREVRDHKDLLMKSNMHLICALQVCRRSHDAQRWDEAPGDSQRQLPIRADDVQTGTKTCKVIANPDRFPEHHPRLLLVGHIDSPRPQTVKRRF